MKRVALRGFALSVVAAGATFAAGGCQEQPVTVAVHSLERSGAVSFVCLAAPGTQPGAQLPIESCNAGLVADTTDYGVDDNGKTTTPHLYGLVTQTTRGEVAVVDMTAINNSVIDEDPSTPGANFLPIGAQPIDIVSTPGSTATFVGVAEVGFEGIFAIPSSMIRPMSPPAVLSSWPACALPSTPGSMILAFDPGDPSGALRGTCDGQYGDAPEAGKNGDIDAEGKGRAKLIVAMPDLGGFIVIDAQTLLDRPAGSFDACPVDRWVPLEVALPGAGADPAPPHGPECSAIPIGAPKLSSAFTSRPEGIAALGSRLYIADRDAPVVHVVDMPTPCEPIERDPLLPSSLEDPTRAVTTSRVAVGGGPTEDLKNYLYALDALDGSVMVFDVTDGATSRAPLRRQHPERNPFQPPDRTRFSAPGRDLIIIQRDVPLTNPATGVAAAGVRCNPEDSAKLCGSGVADCDVGTLYRTSSTFDSGASPGKLRGIFAFVVLTNGRLELIDIDDYDAPCRGPQVQHDWLGCPSQIGPKPVKPSGATDEDSCNVVEPNEIRDGSYFIDEANAGNHEPGVQALPDLFDPNGARIDKKTAPKMIAPLLPAGTKDRDDVLELAVGGNQLAVGARNRFSDAGWETTKGEVTGTDGSIKNGLLMNLEEPRVHVVDQNWTVTYEGRLPGFQGNVAALLSDDAGLHFVDPNSRFCDNGVESQTSLAAILTAEMRPTDNVAGFADYVQIVLDLPPSDDAFWAQAGIADTCTYASCQATYGTTTAPNPARDFTIVEAFQDRVDVVPRGGSMPPNLKCCFPTLVTFAVRAGSQWIAVGDQTGLFNHVIADPDKGFCRNDCDPARSRLNARAFSVSAVPMIEGDPSELVDPMLRFGVFVDPMSDPVVRDMQFRFSTAGSFIPLSISLSSDGTSLVSPQSIRFVPPTGQLAIPDASLEGLILVSTNGVGVTQTFF